MPKKLRVTGPRARFIFPCLLGLVWLCSWPHPAGAEGPGIDLVVLIDQSGSMWGHPEYHPTKNDKWDHRIGGTQEIILRLVDDVRGSSRLHRFSVIDFGDEAEVVWSNQVLRHDPADPDAVKREVDAWLSRRVRAREWINTNTPLAMELAGQELRAMGPGETPTGRRRIVLVVTDGRANLPPADRATMRDRVRRQAEELTELGAEIWVLGLNDADYYWLDGDGAFWEAIAGDEDRVRLAERASTSMPQIFYDITDSWLETISSPVDDEYFSPPYRSRLVFRVNFGKPHGAIRIVDPEGFELTPAAGGPGSVPGTYVHFLRRDPQPGAYKVEKEAGHHYVINVEWSPPKLERLAPAGRADLKTETRVVFQARNAEGEPLVELPEYPITPVLLVTPPAGTPREIPVEAVGEGRFEASWTPEEAGVHHFELRGQVHLPDGGELDVFAASTGPQLHEIEVSSERPYWLELEEPFPTRGFQAGLWTKSLPLEIRLVDSQGEKVVDLAARIEEPETWLAVELIDPSGVALGPAIPLKVGEKGRFEATLPLETDRLGPRGLFQLGEIYMRLIAQPDRLGEEHYLNGLRLPQDAEDKRVGGDAMTVGPLPVRRSGWLLALGSIPALLILAAILFYVFTRVFPNLAIQRRDAKKRGKVELKIFDMAADPNGVGARALNVGGRRYFKFDGKVGAMVDGQKVIAERFRVTRLNMPGKARARLEYRWQGEKKSHTTMLVAGNQKSVQGLEEGTSHTVALLTEGS